MSEPLSATDLERMRAEHVPTDSGLDDERSICASDSCWTMKLDEGGFYDDPVATFWPCDAALLLAELERMWWAAVPRWLTQEEWAAKLEAQGYTKERDGVYSKPRPEFGAAGIAYGLCGPTTTEELT